MPLRLLVLACAVATMDEPLLGKISSDESGVEEDDQRANNGPACPPTVGVGTRCDPLMVGAVAAAAMAPVVGGLRALEEHDIILQRHPIGFGANGQVDYHKVAFTFPSFVSYWGTSAGGWDAPAVTMAALCTIVGTCFLLGAPRLSSDAPLIQRAFNNILLMGPVVGVPLLGLFTDHGPGHPTTWLHQHLFVPLGFMPPIALLLAFFRGTGSGLIKTVIVLTKVMEQVFNHGAAVGIMSKREEYWMNRENQQQAMGFAKGTAGLNATDVTDFKNYLHLGGTIEMVQIFCFALAFFLVGRDRMTSALRDGTSGRWRPIGWGRA